MFKSNNKEKKSEKIEDTKKKLDNQTKKEPIRKSDEKIKEQKSKVEEEKKKEIQKPKEETREENEGSKEINREKDKSEEKIKSDSIAMNEKKKELTSEKKKSQDIKREKEKTYQKQENEKEEDWYEILKKRSKEERDEQEGEKEENLKDKIKSEEMEVEQIWNDPETEGINSDMFKLNNESNDIESVRAEIKKVELLKERIKEEQNQEDLGEGLKVGLEGDISKHTGESDFKNLEISKDFFYKLGRNFHCKDVESLKKLYEKLKSFHKVELYLKNQDCKNIPSSYTIKRLIQGSLKSKSEYNAWRCGIRLREIQNITKGRGGECLSTEYKNSHSKLSFRCKNGHKFESTPAKVKFQDQWCPICNEEATFFYKAGGNFHCKDVESLKKLYEKLKSFPKVELFLKNQDYKNVPSSFTIKRLVQKSFELKTGYKTWRCDIRLREIQDIAKERGGKRLSTEYKNNRTKLRFRCKNGHEFEMTQLNVKFDHWCPTCAGVKKLTLEEFQEIARKRGGECLSTEYKNNYTKLKFQCKNGHEFEAVPDKVKNQEQWCPICSERASERICRGLFEAIFKEDFKKTRPEWLKNSEGHQLELDGYNDELKLAFERQGEQHYEFPNYFFKTIKEFISQLSNDQQKEELCETHGVTLIEVPYWIKYGEYQDYIIKQCKAKGIEVPEIKLKIDWKKFKWDTDNDSNRSLKEWM